MKKKDILTIAISVVVILAASYFVYIMLFPASNKGAATTTTTTSTTQQITGNINQDTIKKLSGLKDYGEANLDNVGRVDPFAPIQ